VVLGAEADLIERSVDLTSLTVVRCAEWSDGMSASLRAGVAAAAECAAVVLWLGDQPAIGAAAVDRVVSARGRAQPTTRVFSIDQRIEFLAYLDRVEGEAGPDHRALVTTVYGDGWLDPFVGLYTWRENA
jgi:CTP:molybdopterin cytidylyltransferase MocA